MQLVDDLLTVRRLEAGNLRLDIGEVDVGDLAAEVAAIVFRHDDRTLEIDLAPHTSVVCDPSRLQQILRNLLENARKYGGPTVRLTTTTADGRCRISVIDDGDGVAEADEDQIFTPFNQGLDSTRQAEGFGLGLSIVRELAVAMGGRVGYQAAQPNGSEFWVEMPVAGHQPTD